jgi:transposase
MLRTQRFGRSAETQSQRTAAHSEQIAVAGSWNKLRSPEAGGLGIRRPRVLRTGRTSRRTEAIFAVAHTMIVIVWHLLAENTGYAELGADYFDKRHDADARQRYLIRELEKLGHTVTLAPAA